MLLFCVFFNSVFVYLASINYRVKLTATVVPVTPAILSQTQNPSLGTSHTKPALPCSQSTEAQALDNGGHPHNPKAQWNDSNSPVPSC